MKRAPFLGATGAVLLAGCGGNHVTSSPLPGVAPSSPTNPKPQSLQLVPTVADPIPANVLAQPIIGEARRFDGAVAPSNWMLAQGQAINVSDNPQLFSVLGTSAGGNAKTMFMLPKPGFGMIVAVAGIFPTSPSQLAQSGRRMTSSSSALTAGARPAGPRVLRPAQVAIRQQRAAALAEEERLRASAISVGRAVTIPVAPELAARIDRSREDARTAALDSLSSSNRTRVQGLVSSVLSGSVSLSAATTQMGASLTFGEADALLSAFDAQQRATRSGWQGMEHVNRREEAANFIVAVAFSRDQLQALRTMPGNQ